MKGNILFFSQQAAVFMETHIFSKKEVPLCYSPTCSFRNLRVMGRSHGSPLQQEPAFLLQIMGLFIHYSVIYCSYFLKISTGFTPVQL